MLRVEAQGNGVYQLVDDTGRAVARVRHTSIRVGAFATEDQAVRAALRGDHLTDAHLRIGPDRSPAGEMAHVRARAASRRARTAPRDARLVHDGADEWIVVDRRPLARLIRPHPSREPSAPSFALEFVVPDAVPWDLRLTIARDLHRVLTEPEPEASAEETATGRAPTVGRVRPARAR